VKEKKEVHFPVRLSLFKADSPQRCLCLDHFGVTANKICPRCNKTKDELWEMDLNFLNNHHRKGLLELLQLLKKDLDPVNFEHVIHFLSSFVVNFDLTFLLRSQTLMDSMEYETCSRI